MTSAKACSVASRLQAACKHIVPQTTAWRAACTTMAYSSGNVHLSHRLMSFLYWLHYTGVHQWPGCGEWVHGGIAAPIITSLIGQGQEYGYCQFSHFFLGGVTSRGYLQGDYLTELAYECSAVRQWRHSMVRAVDKCAPDNNTTTSPTLLVGLRRCVAQSYNQTRPS